MKNTETLKSYMPKRITLVFVILILMYGVIYGKDFRNTSWGMTKAQVKKVETGEFYSEREDRITYIDELNNYKVLVIYWFVNNKLARSRYSMIDAYADKNDYLREYITIHDLLNKKYGEAKIDTLQWKDYMYLPYPSKWGLAISLAQASFYSSWENNRTIIDLAIYGKDNKIYMILEYSSKKLAPLEKKERDKNTLDDF